MFEPDAALLLPDRRQVSLREVAGVRGVVVVGVGRGAERGFQMLHRFHDVGERLAATGIHLAFLYPRQSSRHVLDALSVAGTKFRRHPVLLLDVDERFFAQGVWARSLEAVHLDPQMRRLEGAVIDTRTPTWASELQVFLERCQ